MSLRFDRSKKLRSSFNIRTKRDDSWSSRQSQFASDYLNLMDLDRRRKSFAASSTIFEESVSVSEEGSILLNMGPPVVPYGFHHAVSNISNSQF